jgi:hypothetical protein
MMERNVKGVTYRASVAARDELRTLHEFCTLMVPGGFAAFEKWLERYDRNPQIFYAITASVTRPPAADNRIVGAFAVTPLGEEARALLDAERLKGIDLKVEQITPPGEKPAAMYISGIVASGFSARGVTLEFLVSVMRREAARGNRLFYTRPMSRDGLRVVRDYGFEPIDPAAAGKPDRIYRRGFGGDAAPAPLDEVS